MCNGMQNVEINEILQPIKGLGTKVSLCLKKGEKKRKSSKKKGKHVRKIQKKKKMIEIKNAETF